MTNQEEHKGFIISLDSKRGVCVCDSGARRIAFKVCDNGRVDLVKEARKRIDDLTKNSF